MTTVHASACEYMHVCACIRMPVGSIRLQPSQRNMCASLSLIRCILAPCNYTSLHGIALHSVALLHFTAIHYISSR
ncbi:unnamed protein product [Onchocerca flexuosa]|uniref:Secreted protein n=1 Tax=Onchocerca flexuosa TaxID=387005 RepID=A0A183I8H2_9BILA|nr:unnamed protein product [Onchocerca flexuosa]